MAEYYVIRDKNTGLYFRGKGVNRWGKYYNQASVYRVKGMAENTIKEVSWRGEQAEIVPIQIIETSSDVVPKSEGEWKDKDKNGISIHGFMVCSVCNVMIPTCDNGNYCLNRLDYCPRCGAHMKGGAE